MRFALASASGAITSARLPMTVGKKRTKALKLRKRGTAAHMGFVLGPRAETKQRMLAATMQYLRENGLGDFTLRQLAERLGTSHRLLIYHFGTKEGLLVAVVEEIEREQQSWLMSLSERDMTLMQLMQLAWERTCDPQLDSHLRLFVEVYGHALQGRAHTAPLLDTLVDAWLGPLNDLFQRAGMTAAQARVHARLWMATVRGLMLDLLTTRDLAATTEAWKHFMAQYDSLPGAHGPGRLRKCP